MAKKTDSKYRADLIVSELIMNAGGVSKADLAFLQRYINSHADYAEWFRNNFGTTNVTVGRGVAKDAKDVYNTFGFTPTPNRGKVGQDNASMIMRSGMRTNQNGQWADVKIDKVKGRGEGREELYTATPSGGRQRTPAELNAIIKRGMSGATMNLEDQRIYDRWVAERRQKAQDDENERIKEDLDRKKSEDRAKKFRLLGMRDDGTLDDVQVDDLIARREARQKTNEELYKQRALEEYKAEIAAEEAAEKRRQAETDNGRTPDMTDEDYAQWMNMGGSKFARWDYSDKDRQAIEKSRMDIQDALNSNRINGFEAAQMNRELDEQIANGRWKKQVMRTPLDDMTAEQIFNGYTMKMDDGTILGKKNDNTLYTVFAPKKEAEKQVTINGMNFQQLLSGVPKSRKVSMVDENGNPYTEEQDIPIEERVKIAEEFAKKRGVDFENNTKKSVIERLAEMDNAEDGAMICPICGYPLDENGYCAKCGYQEGAEVAADGAAASGEEPEAQPIEGGMKASYL